MAKAVESVGGRLESFYFAFGDREVDAAVKRSVGYRPSTTDEPLHLPGAAAPRR